MWQCQPQHSRSIPIPSVSIWGPCTCSHLFPNQGGFEHLLPISPEDQQQHLWHTLPCAHGSWGSGKVCPLLHSPVSYCLPSLLPRTLYPMLAGIQYSHTSRIRSVRQRRATGPICSRLIGIFCRRWHQSIRLNPNNVCLTSMCWSSTRNLNASIPLTNPTLEQSPIQTNEAVLGQCAVQLVWIWSHNLQAGSECRFSYRHCHWQLATCLVERPFPLEQLSITVFEVWLTS